MQIIYGFTCCFVCGLYISLQNEFLGISTTIAFCLAALLMLLAVAGRRSKTLLLFLCCSACCLGYGNGIRLGPPLDELETFYGKQVHVTGYIDTCNTNNESSSMSCIISADRLVYKDKVNAYNGRVRVSVQGKENLLGNYVDAYGTLEKLTAFRNPGSFNGELYNRVQNIGGRVKKAQVTVLDNTSSLVFKLRKFNQNLRQKIVERLGTRAGNLTSGMLLGGNGVDEATRELFAQNGLAHLLSVSGTHLLLLTSFLAFLLRKQQFLGASWCNGIILIVLLGYALLCGMRPPVTRALLMSMTLLVDDKRAERGAVLCLALLVMLAYKPLWLLDLGLQLSFGASCGLIWLLPKCKQFCSKFMPELLCEPLAITLAAQLATLPLLIVNFHYVSLIAFLSNILLVPLLEGSVLLTVVGLLVPGFGICVNCAGFILEQVLVQAVWLRGLPYSILTIGSLPLCTVVVYYALLLLWSDVRVVQFFSNRARRWGMGVLTALLVGIFVWQRFVPMPPGIYFLDVGQGDCVVVTTPEREVYVYDTGGLQGMDTGTRIVVPFLRSLGCDRIKVLFLSHYDFDHAGGAVGVLQNVRVEQLVLPAEKLTQESEVLAAEIARVAKLRKTTLLTAQAGMCWGMEKGSIRVLAVPQSEVAGNEASTVVELQSKYGNVLLTGDMGVSGEENLALDKQYFLFKAGHHGSKGSNSTDFLRRIRPALTVVSCGNGNRYGHPHAETLKRLAAIGSEVLRTDKLGAIRVELNRQKNISSYTSSSWQNLNLDL